MVVLLSTIEILSVSYKDKNCFKFVALRTDVNAISAKQKSYLLSQCSECQ